MGIPMLLLTAGASIGVGALSAPAVGAALSKSITGEIVPTRLTDLAGYLTGSGGKGLGFSDVTDAFGITIDGQDPDSGQSVGSVDNTAATQSPLKPAPPQGGPKAPTPTVATATSKRMLAVASLGAGLTVAVMTFLLIRRVTGGVA